MSDGRLSQPCVVVVGLGPAGRGLLTAGTTAAIARIPRRFLRTTRHPAADAVAGAVSFDHVYDQANAVEEVYPAIVEELVGAAADEGEVLYAVPGSPMVAERTVELLVADVRIRTEIHPALSFVDLAWAAVGVDPLATGARLVDGRRFAVQAAGERGPLLVGQCDSRQVLSDIKLSVDDPPPGSQAVTVLQRLGLGDQRVRSLSWDELDREVEPDHLTSLFIPEMASPVAMELIRFSELVRTLRECCPWDREQTHASLTRHLVEEAYEVLEAIAALDQPGGYEALEEELGDVLFQVVFHATLAAEAGEFTLADVARRVHDKLVSRHPHVFGQVAAHTSGAVAANWERIKQAEKGRGSVMEGIPADLPALLYAHKVQRKAETMGLDLGSAEGPEPTDHGPTDHGPTDHDDVGARLFALVADARRRGVDPEDALRVVTSRVRIQFEELERAGDPRLPERPDRA